MNPQHPIPHFNKELLLAAQLQPPMAVTRLSAYSLLTPEQLAIVVRDRDEICGKTKMAVEYLSLASPQLDRHHFIIELDLHGSEQTDPVRFERCSNFIIYWKNQDSVRIPPTLEKYLLFVDCSDFSIVGLATEGGKDILTAHNCSNFQIKKVSSANSEGVGLIIHNCRSFSISECHFSNLKGAGVLLVGSSSNGEIKNSTISNSRGFLNQDAGIHLCCTSENITLADVPRNCHEPLPIEGKNQKPHHIHVKNCVISHCRAQGIYLEGAINCLIEDNLIIGNNKEGICLDWGSCNNYLLKNIVVLNGKRENLSDTEIKADFITGYPLLQDGSSSMKLPGISLDNGLMSVIENNTISNNYGGGIKMIRTAMFNVITRNEIFYNAIGANKFVPHFHGITVLGLGAVNGEFNAERSNLLDFLPSVFNTIADNTIEGHWKPIFSDKVSSANSVYDNRAPRTPREYSRILSITQKIKASLQRFFSRLARRMQEISIFLCPF